MPRTRELDYQELLLAIRNIGESGFFDSINFVGGEPTTSPILLPLVKETKKAGLRASIVTNGFLLSRMPSEKFRELVSELDCVGLSIDSLSESTNRLIGRIAGNAVLSRDEYETLCCRIKQLGCRLKINTVVSSLNYDEDFSSFYRTVQPDRIKVFQVLKPEVITKQRYDDLLISSGTYRAFLLRHSSFDLVAEDNDDMTGAYYMLGSDGCFWDNATGKKSDSILSVPVEEALKAVYVNEDKYQKRYA